MIPSQTANALLLRAFAPSPGGIMGLTDQLLEACVGSDVKFKRVGDRWVCHLYVDEEIQEALVPLPPAAFRTILARIAALCNEHSPNAVTPYGGEGFLAVKGPTPTVVRVTFVNTPNEQRLEVKRNAEASIRPLLTGEPETARHSATSTLTSSMPMMLKELNVSNAALPWPTGNFPVPTALTQLVLTDPRVQNDKITEIKKETENEASNARN